MPPTMSPAFIRRAARHVLLIVTAFNALSALAGGVAIIATGGLGMPLSFLTGSPFTTFTVPGLILFFVVGGSQAVAAQRLFARRPSALFWSVVAGFGMVIWIFVEIAIIAEVAWLQILYFATGSAQLVFVFVLFGIVDWLPRRAVYASGRGDEENGSDV